MTGWGSDRVAVAFDDLLLNWQLGDGHPSNPVRAKLAIEEMRRLGVALDVEPISIQAQDELLEVHSSTYVHEVLDGHSSEWQGLRRDLGAVAAHMFAGTVQLVRAVDDGRVRIGFTPQGAKHHAMQARGSGFCVFNDMAWAARHFADASKRVLYIDLDAHHGDGVEALTRDHPKVMTCSVHDRTIFPGTGHQNSPTEQVYNFPLVGGAGDNELLASVAEIRTLADRWQPEVLLIAIGADGHRTDPLSSLQYSYRGYRAAAAMLGTLAGDCDIPVLLGGAGGYQPTTHTPRVWAHFVASFLAAAHRFPTAVS